MRRPNRAALRKRPRAADSSRPFPRVPCPEPILNPSPVPPPALEGAGLTKRFAGRLALDAVDLRVEEGETVALVGESGSGKTTLLRVFNALVRPDAGDAWVAGRPVGAQDPVRLRRGIGYVPQEGGLLPHWTVGRNVALVPALLGMPDARERALGALRRVGLDPGPFEDRFPGTLSGGQRQRVALARGLAAGPAVVLLDEPFGALDALSRAEILDTFGEVLGSGAVSALLVTHDLAVAFRLARRVAVMRGGRILQCGTPETLRSAPADPYVTALLDRGGVL